MHYLDKFRLDGRVALITGGASGIGLAAAQAFRGAGVHVVVTDLHPDAVDEAAARLNLLADGGYPCW